MSKSNLILVLAALFYVVSMPSALAVYQSDSPALPFRSDVPDIYYEPIQSSDGEALPQGADALPQGADALPQGGDAFDRTAGPN